MAPTDETPDDGSTGEPDDYSVAKEKMQGESESEDIADVAEPDVGMSDRLIPGLTQHRTKAASNKPAKNPVVDRTSLVCRPFCERYTAYGSSRLDHIFQVSITDNAFGYRKLEETPYGLEIDERYAECKELQSLNDEDIWNKIASMTIDERLMLLAYCLPYGFNLVEGKATQVYNANRRRSQKDLLFEVLDFDMCEEDFILDAIIAFRDDQGAGARCYCGNKGSDEGTPLELFQERSDCERGRTYHPRYRLVARPVVIGQ